MLSAIETISLDGMLPSVFSGDRMPRSEVWGTNLTLHRGVHYLIEAVSGAGKSSLCAYIYGSRSDYEGVLRFNGVDVRTFTIDCWQSLRRLNMAYLPQELSLFPELTAIENIRLKNSLTSHLSEDRILGWMRMLGIDSRCDFPVGKMSVGQQQRVGILRALCQPFDFILLDEPVSHLDERNNRLAATIILEVAEATGASVVATSVGNHLIIPDAIHLKL